MSNFDPPSKFPIPPTSIAPFRQPVNRGQEPWNRRDIQPLDWLLALMRSSDQPMDRRMEAAKIAAPYRHRSYRPVRTEEQLRLAQERLRQMPKPK